jgi:hypothetical protein
MLTPLTDNVWEINQPLSLAGVEIGHRMTVIRLGGGDLLVHSPAGLDETLVHAISELGFVRYVIAPSRMHDLYLTSWRSRFPQAIFCCAPGLEKDHPELKFNEILADHSPAYWYPEMKHRQIQGMPKLNEFVFYHKPSRSLMVADLVFNVGGTMPLLSELFWRLNGAYNKLAPSHLFKMKIKDREAMRTSLDQVLSWDFDRIIIGHGANVERGGKDALWNAFKWL